MNQPTDPQQSNGDTSQPTANSSQPSINPSLILSNQPTNPPSLITRSQTSDRPSLIPVTQNSIAPSLVTPDSDLCKLSTTGFYGTRTARVILINYDYEMNYLKSYDINGILNNLEHTISGVLANSTIPECRAFRKMQDKEQRGNLENFVMGISSSPNDSFVAKCSPQSTSSNSDCGIISGTLTLYLRDTGRFLRSLSEVDRIKTAVGKIIADGMNSGELADAHKEIISLSHLSYTTPNQIASNLKDAKEIEVSNGFPTYGWAILSCGIILFLIAVGIAIQKRLLKRRQKSTETDSDTSEVLLYGRGRSENDDSSSIHGDDSTVEFS